jgi:hypothetical protein
MKTLVEKDSSLMGILVVVTVTLLIFLGGGFGLAYLGGVFTGKNEVIENDRRITKQNLSHQTPEPAKP